MSNEQSVETVREAVGVFDSAESLETAIDELLSSGFDRADLSLLASEATVTDKLGSMYSKVEDAEDDPNVPRKAFVATNEVGDAEGALVGALLYVGAVVAAASVVATGGTLLTMITATVAAGGTGGLIGTALARLVGRRHADYLEKQLEQGGLLLWVRTWDAADEDRAQTIMSKHAAHDVHVHDLNVAA